jgi:hypothetical protein
MSEFEQRPDRAQSNLLSPTTLDRATSQPVRAERQTTDQQPLGNQAAQRFAQFCPLGLPSPSVCPFGGICHACPVQAKPTEGGPLKVNEPGDQYEQEADRVADQVISMPEPRVQRQEEEPEEEEEPVQAKPLAEQITPLIQRQPEEEEEEPEPSEPKEEEEIPEEEEEEPIQAKLAEGTQIQRQEEELEEEEEPEEGEVPEEEEKEEEEPVQAKPLAEQITPVIQRQIEPEEDEEEEESIQTKLAEGTQIQRQEEEPEEEEEEPIQAKPLLGQTTPLVQRQVEPEEEEEPVQTKLSESAIQRQEEEPEDKEEEPVQTKLADGTQIQRQEEEPEEEEEEEPVQTKLAEDAQIQRQEKEKKELIQARQAEATLQHQTKKSEDKSIQTRRASRQTRQPSPREAFGSTGELTSGGSPLPENLRKSYQGRFYRDLRNVRLHTGPQAERYSAALQAQAFTYSNHIWLGKNQHVEPSFTLSHELAHVIQQCQPPTLEHKEAPSPTEPAYGTAPTVHFIQRLPFWVPIDTTKGRPMSGSTIHKAVLNAIKGNGIDVEAPVPNAFRDDWGLGLWGSADIYKAPSRVGIYFDGPVSNKYGKDRFKNPKRHRRAGGSPKPSLAGKKIENIKDGPTSIGIGELKPADSAMLDKGAKQIGNYIEGFVDTWKLTNKWAKHQASTQGNQQPPRWNLTRSKVKRLKPGQVPIPSTYKYNPRAPKSDLELCLADVFEGTGRVKYFVRPIYVPNIKLGKSIKGGLYVRPYRNGMWMYFARPANFSKALELPRYKKEERQAYMRVANSVQDEVIGKLKKGPKAVNTLRLGHRSGRLPNSRPPIRITTDRRAPILRRRRSSTHKLVDEFQYKPWKQKQKQLGTIIRQDRAGGKPGGTPRSKTFETLKFLEMAYNAERGLQATGAGRSNFPKKRDLEVKIRSGKGKTRRVVQKSLATMYSWMKVWTGWPVRQFLGKFRAVFGTAFVKLANGFASLKRRIRYRVRKLFKRESASKAKGSGYVAIAIRAMVRILRAVISLLLRQTSRVLARSLSEGLKNRLAAILPLNFKALQAASKNGFRKYRALTSKLAGLQKRVHAFIKGVVDKYTSKLAGVKSVLKKVSKVAKIIRAAVVAIQCGTPPFWGCLKLLLRSLTSKIIRKVLGLCWVQRKIASLVMGLSFFKNLPLSLAGFVAERINNILKKIHPQLAPVFAKITPGKSPSASEIGCGGGSSKLQDMIAELVEQLGEEKFEKLMRKIENSDISDETPLTDKEIAKMRDLIKRKKFNNLDRFLKQVESKSRPRAMTAMSGRIAREEFKEQFADMRKRRYVYWIAPLNTEELRKRRATGKLFLYQPKGGKKYAGLADVQVIRCRGRSATIKFVRVEAKDEKGTPAKLDLLGKKIKGNLSGVRCPTGKRRPRQRRR